MIVWQIKVKLKLHFYMKKLDFKRDSIHIKELKRLWIWENSNIIYCKRQEYGRIIRNLNIFT